MSLGDKDFGPAWQAVHAKLKGALERLTGMLPRDSEQERP